MRSAARGLAPAFGEPRFTNDVDIIADFTGESLDRAVFLADTGLSETPTPFVTPEDILLAKLHWFRAGGEISEVQWRDIRGIVRACGATLDRGYLERNAAKLGIAALLEKALTEI
jgi:hypothetical protein